MVQAAMLVTSALRRRRTSNASSSTASVQRGAAGFVAGAAWPGQGLGQSPAEKETSGDTNKMPSLEVASPVV